MNLKLFYCVLLFLLMKINLRCLRESVDTKENTRKLVFSKYAAKNNSQSETRRNFIVVIV